MLLSAEKRRLLLSEQTSHANKMAFLAEYRLRGFFVETDWLGDVSKRARFRFEPGGPWLEARDYLNDAMNGPHMIKMGSKS